MGRDTEEMPITAAADNTSHSLPWTVQTTPQHSVNGIDMLHASDRKPWSDACDLGYVCYQPFFPLSNTSSSWEGKWNSGSSSHRITELEGSVESI